MRAVRISSLLFPLAISSCAADLVVPAPGGEFRLTNVAIWKYVKARDEKIPALWATIHNRTGNDWSSATFQVRAPCPDGGERSYRINLKNLPLGPTEVGETAFDSIGVVGSCDESKVEIEFRGGVPAAPVAYVVIGFAWESGGHWSTGLEAILDHRQPAASLSRTSRITWRDGGSLLLERGGPDPVAFYAFRVDPGNFGLAGFSLSPAADDTGPLNRFLRFYQLPEGKAAYLGVFRVFKGNGSEVGVRYELDPAGLQALRSREGGIHGRELVLVEPGRPLNHTTTTLDK